MMRVRATGFVVVLAALIAGCSGSDTGTQPSPGASGAEVSTSRDVATPAGNDASITPTDMTGQSGPLSCADEMGVKSARLLASQCVAVSPATHPPCNVANSCAMMRNEIARGCALIGKDASATPECGSDPISQTAAAATIERYYSAINARDYAAAWTLWGDDGQPGKTLDQFTAGFNRTRRTRVIVGSVSTVEGGAGSLYVAVPVRIDAELVDGRHQHFVGSYDLRQINRGMGLSQGWHIMSAKLRPA